MMACSACVPVLLPLPGALLPAELLLMLSLSLGPALPGLLEGSFLFLVLLALLDATPESVGGE